MSEGIPDFRDSALAAFSHEIRTPLTAIRMICDLAAPDGDSGRVLDGELFEMLQSSLSELQVLVDDLQDLSRAERSALAFDPAAAQLGTILKAGMAQVAEQVTVSLEGDVSMSGHWDEGRLSRAIAGIAVGVSRLGDGSGSVEARISATEETCQIELSSGTPSTKPDPSFSSSVFAFFSAIAILEAMGALVSVQNGAGFCRCLVELPRALNSP